MFIYTNHSGGTRPQGVTIRKGGMNDKKNVLYLLLSIKSIPTGVNVLDPSPQ